MPHVPHTRPIPTAHIVLAPSSMPSQILAGRRMRDAGHLLRAALSSLDPVRPPSRSRRRVAHPYPPLSRCLLRFQVLSKAVESHAHVQGAGERGLTPLHPGGPPLGGPTSSASSTRQLQVCHIATPSPIPSPSSHPSLPHPSPIPPLPSLHDPPLTPATAPHLAPSRPIPSHPISTPPARADVARRGAFAAAQHRTSRSTVWPPRSAPSRPHPTASRPTPTRPAPPHPIPPHPALPRYPHPLHPILSRPIPSPHPMLPSDVPPRPVPSRPTPAHPAPSRGAQPHPALSCPTLPRTAP